MQELITQAGARVHLERERALGRIEELLDGAGERECCETFGGGCSRERWLPEAPLATAAGRRRRPRLAAAGELLSLPPCCHLHPQAPPALHSQMKRWCRSCATAHAACCPRRSGSSGWAACG